MDERGDGDGDDDDDAVELMAAATELRCRLDLNMAANGGFRGVLSLGCPGCLHVLY